MANNAAAIDEMLAQAGLTRAQAARLGYDHAALGSYIYLHALVSELPESDARNALLAKLEPAIETARTGSKIAKIPLESSAEDSSSPLPAGAAHIVAWIAVTSKVMEPLFDYPEKYEEHVHGIINMLTASCNLCWLVPDQKFNALRVEAQSLAPDVDFSSIIGQNGLSLSKPWSRYKMLVVLAYCDETGRLLPGASA